MSTCMAAMIMCIIVHSGSDIVSYFLELSGAFSIEVDVGADVLSYTFTGLTESTTYK